MGILVSSSRIFSDGFLIAIVGLLIDLLTMLSSSARPVAILLKNETSAHRQINCASDVDCQHGDVKDVVMNLRHRMPIARRSVRTASDMEALARSLVHIPAPHIPANASDGRKMMGRNMKAGVWLAFRRLTVCFTAKRFEKLAGGKQSATTGYVKKLPQHPDNGARLASLASLAGCMAPRFHDRWCACRRPPANLCNPFRMNRIHGAQCLRRTSFVVEPKLLTHRI